MIQGKSIDQWQAEYPLLKKIMKTEEVFWLNPKYQKSIEKEELNIELEDIKEADVRLRRFAPYIQKVFPKTKDSEGIIESDLENIDDFKPEIKKIFDEKIPGNLYIKRDDNLPIAGSIKARGGIYEVLKYAETLALNNNLINKNEDYSKFTNPIFKNLFKQYSLAVGSTGNLGLSIGITGATLGFKTTVHMSGEAREWKKDLLKSKGVIVKEYDSDYSKAVEEGRKESKKDSKSYFVDDEKSKDLFLGYAVAALRLKEQFKKENIKVDKYNPLFVYLPCGVGGGPGGICFGLRKVFGPNVHCFFAEPTHSPAMLIGMMTGLHNKITVQDFGIDNITAADGLAVGKPSKFVGKLMEDQLAGIFTVQDDILFKLLKRLYKEKDIKLEPSALAGFPGPVKVSKNFSNFNFMKDTFKEKVYKSSTHLVWATGGSMVPDHIFKNYLAK